MSDHHRSPHDDERLVMFLQQYCPSAPPASLDSEEKRLLQALDCAPDPLPTVPHPTERSQSAMSGKRRRRALWAIPGAIAAGALLAWGGYRVGAPQLAQRRAAELEEFLVRSWTDIDPTPASTLSDLEAAWLLSEDLTDSSFGNTITDFGVRAEPASASTP